ncbi:MAG: type II secretion system GspH family protein [Firmicutes bacterium]|jgi:prepilin-type N-terminal cleavage/methylation domain-containing protein|nr:type II secretion system GspH family protein [Bacillota bacterium]
MSVVRACRRSECGFTLLEVIVAIVLVGTGLIALLHSMGQAVDVDMLASRAQTAANLANETLELYRVYFNNHDYDLLVNQTETQQQPALDEAGYHLFRRSVSVTESGTAPNRYWTVSVTVRYAVKEQMRSVRFQTVFAER